MKEIYFIKWLWNKSVSEVKSWDRWHWAWMATCGFGTNAIMFRDQNPNWFVGVLIVTTAFWVGYAMIYTGIKKAYGKFQAEQDNILNHLKDSK